jgi:hypothetical protein
MRVTEMRYKLQLLAAVILMTLCAACNSAKLPHELLGIWRTDVPAYKGKFMKLDEKYLVLGVGDEKVVPRKIEEVSYTTEGKEKLYTVKTNEKDEGEYTISFYFNPAEGGTIRFKNQPQLQWKKRDIEVE